MRKQLTTLTLMVSIALMVCASAPVRSDDSDIFTLAPQVEPNVVILMDSSGSMRDEIDGQRKIDIAKAVISGLITNVTGLRFGVFAFEGAGGRVVSQVGSSQTATVTAINSIVADGGTPLGGATEDIHSYFEGTFVDDSRLGLAPAGGSAPPYASPIQFECQVNYVILMTDGLPSSEFDSYVIDEAGSLQTSDLSGFTGLQNAIVHTVGFDVPEGRDLLTATALAGGGNFYTAANAVQLRNALKDALSDIIEETYAFTVPLIPSKNVTGGDKAYFAAFQPSGASPIWDGQLKAYQRDSSGLVPTDADGRPLASALVWDAGQLLANTAASSRTIFTAVGGTRTNFALGNSSLTPTLLGVAGTTARDNLIQFTRGVDVFDLDADSDSTEDREWKLGDIYHSTPVLVFPPPLYSLDQDYRNFQQAQSNRTAVLLAGTNGGMLHAFRETDGTELWAFVPPDQLNRLGLLSRATGPHPFFVDSSPIVADIKIGTAWKTIALFGLRRGGGGYHALDITDTTNPSYMWSFSDSKIVESWSEPAIGKIILDDDTEKFVAFFGGGYDTARNNASGKAFFVIDLATGQKLWEYSNTGSGDSQHMNFSIAASPVAADLDGNGYVDRIYVGDVGGQLWKFDLSNPATLSGGMVTNWTGKRLFAADPSQQNPPPAGAYQPGQAMYGTPALALGEYGELWVFIGTGDRNRPNSTSSNNFIGIKDNTTMSQGSTLTPANLTDGRTTNPVTQGWYLPLRTSEKVLSSAEIFNSAVYFTTFTPTTVATCGGAGGTARLYSVKTKNGHAALSWPTGDPLGTTDGTETRDKVIGDGIPSEPDVVLGDNNDSVVVGTTDQEIEDQTLPRVRLKRQRYWREAY